MLEHVPDPEEIVSDCEKMLNKNGHIFSPLLTEI